MCDPTGERTPEAEYVSFYNDRCVWRGEEFVARCDPDDNALEVAAAA